MRVHTGPTPAPDPHSATQQLPGTLRDEEVSRGRGKLSNAGRSRAEWEEERLGREQGAGSAELNSPRSKPFARPYGQT